MNNDTLALLELGLVFALVLGLAVRELWSVRGSRSGRAGGQSSPAERSAGSASGSTATRKKASESQGRDQNDGNEATRGVK